METEFQKRVAKAKIEGIDNAYVAISAYYDPKKQKLDKRMTFFYVSSDSCIVEWEPEYGPITVIYKCNEDHEDAEPHWYFDYCTGMGNWSQCAVDDYRLKPAYARGDYKYIFSVLSRYGEQ